MKEKDKLFKVYARDMASQKQAELFEDLLNSEKFRDALLAEIEKYAKEIAENLFRLPDGKPQ
jgi:hypothetical protein